MVKVNVFPGSVHSRSTKIFFSLPFEGGESACLPVGWGGVRQHGRGIFEGFFYAGFEERKGDCDV